MFTKRFRVAAFVLAAMLPLAACDDGITSAESGPVSILLTDAPGDVQSAVVTIEEIYLQGSDDENGGRVWLMDEAVTVDLLDLTNTAIELVGEVEVPAGTYAQLRFVISGGYLEVAGEGDETQIFASAPDYEHVPEGRTVDGALQMPSYAQTGIKVNLPNGAVQVSSTGRILLVDFNVAESFGQEAGASGMWVMNPVIHAVDFHMSPSITVELGLDDGVELPEDVTLADFTAHLDDGAGNTKEDAFTETDAGTFEAVFPFLLPDQTWYVDVEAPEGISVTTDPELPQQVDTQPSTDVEVEVTITSVATG